MPKWSRLAEKTRTIRSGPNHLKAGPFKAGPKKCPRDGHSKAGQSGFRRGTVCIYVYVKGFMNFYQISSFHYYWESIFLN